ncbi:MAG: CHAT domain-containing tetratricopeptide repeat protein [Bacteroidales bacterium]
MNLGRFYNQISAYEKAIFYLDLAEQTIKKEFTDKHPSLSYLYWNKGGVYFLTGDYSKSIQYLTEAKRIIETKYSKESPLLPSIRMDLALAFEANGYDAEALEYYQLSLKNAPSPLQIKVLRNMAMFYLRKNEPQTAHKYIVECVHLLETSGMNNQYERANTLMRYGQILDAPGDPASLEKYREALFLYQQIFGPKHRDVAIIHALIGDYYSKKADLDSALFYYHEGILAITPAFLSTNKLHNPEYESLSTDLRTVSFLTLKAKTLYLKLQENGDIKYLTSAIDCYEKSIYVIEQFNRAFRAEESKILLTEGYYDNYTSTINLYLTGYDLTKDHHYIEKAFEICEKGKAAVLLAELKDENARRLGLIPEDLIILEKSIRNNLYLYKTNILQAQKGLTGNDQKVEFLRSALFVQEQKYDSLIRVYENLYPDYYRLKYDLSVIPLKDLQHLLRPSQAVLEYALSEEQLFTFLITADDVKVFRTAVDSTLTSDIFALRNNLIIPKIEHYTYQDFLVYQETSFALYNLLIKPLSEHIAGKHIIIIPDGALAYLSFEALIKDTVPSDTIAFRKLPYLIHDCSISYAISSTIFNLTRKEKRPRLTSGVLALAPTYDLNFRGMPELTAELNKFPIKSRNLPGAIKEADYILEIMKGRKLVGEDATEAAFKQLAGRYDVLHFAMHARINDENPLSSRLSFYPFGDTTEDNFLHTYEIYNMALNGHMAVLSACATGDGRLFKGEGVMSLARAFAFAGIPSLLMTLWDVEDFTSGFIIPYFYQLLSSGKAKDEALRQAKLEYLELAKLEIETHPVFWSGFILYGDPIGFSNVRKHYLIIAMSFLLMLMILPAVVLSKRYIKHKERKSTLTENP